VIGALSELGRSGRKIGGRGLLDRNQSQYSIHPFRGCETRKRRLCPCTRDGTSGNMDLGDSRSRRSAAASEGLLGGGQAGVRKPRRLRIEANERGERYVWLEDAMADRLGAIRGPGESYSDVIIRFAGQEALATRRG